MPRWPMACRWALCLVLGLAACAGARATGDAAREAFRACDAQAFLALNIARNYLMSERNRSLVMPYVEGSPMAQAMAEELFRRVEAGEIRHPGQFAADTLFQCAAEMKMRVGASRARAALCFTRTDIAFFLHAERDKKVVRQQAVSNVSKRLSVRGLYPTALINSVAAAVYTPAQPPDLRQLMGAVAWGCIHDQSAEAASAAGR